MEYLLLLVGIFLVAKILKLQGRVKALEERMSERQPEAISPVVVKDVAETAAPEEVPLPVQTMERPQAPLPSVGPAPVEDEPPPTVPAPQTRPVVFTADVAERLMRFLRENWVYVVSAASLALAGVFLVQYGIERGLIPPVLRVLAAVALGMALIVAGEYLRRRFGDEPDASTAYLPATFSGAGIVSVFAAVMAARQLYGLIGPDAAMAGYVLTALTAVVLGWFNGALLVAIGLLGAAAAPFLVGGDAEAAPWLYLYYGLVAAMGLAVDTLRRWAWVSVLALVLGLVGARLMRLEGAGVEGWILFLLGLPLLATALPDRSLFPRHAGPATIPALWARHLPPFPVRLAAGALAASCLFLWGEMPGPAGSALFALTALVLLALMFLIWASEAEGLADLAVMPSLTFLLALAEAAFDNLPLASAYANQTIALRPPEVAAPMLASQIVGLAVAVTLAVFWRSLRPQPLALWHGIAAVLVAPLAVVICDLFWQPSAVVGAFRWALHPMALAALMVAFALAFAGRDGSDHRRTAHAALSSLSLIALSLFILSSATPLTLALSVLVVVAAALDRRFGLPEMSLFIQIGAAVLTSRLMLDPGLFWAFDAPVWSVLLAFGGPIAAAVAGLALYRGLPRPLTCGVLESAAMFWLLMLGDVLIGRWINDGMGLSLETHWGMSLLAMPWLGMALVQAYRTQFGGFVRLRRWLASIAAALALILLALAVFVLNPLFSLWPDDQDGLARGPMLADSLALAYLVPGVIMLVAALRLPVFAAWVRLSMLTLGSALTLLYLGLEIRRFWQGDWLGRPDVAQGELYTYTLALMVLGAGLLYTAIARRSQALRKLAMAVIAVTVAKVFLLDASGLTGLMRVASFLGLGLSLAGLAWLNRWAMQVARQGAD